MEEVLTRLQWAKIQLSSILCFKPLSLHFANKTNILFYLIRSLKEQNKFWERGVVKQQRTTSLRVANLNVENQIAFLTGTNYFVFK